MRVKSRLTLVEMTVSNGKINHAVLRDVSKTVLPISRPKNTEPRSCALYQPTKMYHVCLILKLTDHYNEKNVRK